VSRTRPVTRWMAAGALAVAAGAGLVRVRWPGRSATGRSGLVTSDGVRLHVEADGPTDSSVAAVLVHGLGVRADSLEPQWSMLRRGVRVVRYDQRGHGRSGWGGAREATPDRLGRDLEEVLGRYVPERRVVVVAHSLGGMAVLALADRRPDLFADRIGGAALLSTFADPVSESRLSPRGARMLVRSRAGPAVAWTLWLLAPVIDAIRPFRHRWGRRRLRDRLFGAIPPDDNVVAMAEREWQRMPWLHTMSFLPGLVEYDQRSALEALAGIPVLVVSGSDDTVVPPLAARRLAHRIGPSARLLVVEGAGHMAHLTSPDEVDEALRSLVWEAGQRPHLRETT
jgi:pimeloyl-ACP methyl ester carboxylesterase